MKKEQIAEYYYDLIRLALSKHQNRQDAEDLVSETILAAVIYLDKGGVIEHPKTWLANTLMHKYNDIMRRKYNRPCVINIESCLEIADDAENADYEEEYAAIRREVNYLSRLTREVTILHYFGNLEITEIAERLGIPVGTVKSRLYAGRNQIKKGFDQMNAPQNALPGKLYLTFGGEGGSDNRPISLAEGDLIVQNLLMLAYEKPLTISNLAKAIGIPAAYIEPIIEKLVDGELMVKTGNDTYYTDFIIYQPEDSLSCFDSQLLFVNKHFETIWGIVSDMLAGVHKLDFYGKLNEHQRVKLERYAVMKAIQDFQLQGTGTMQRISFPARRDGGHWLANAYAIPAGCDENKSKTANEYVVYGGHRRSQKNINGTRAFELLEFDTTLWDSPRRFVSCGYDNYFSYIHTLLWSIYKSIPLEESDIPGSVIADLPNLENVGLICTENGRYQVDIPVISADNYRELSTCIDNCTAGLIRKIGSSYADFLKGAAISVPPHLKSVPELFKMTPATGYIVMAVVRKAYERGLHLKGVDYCCPPAVLVYYENQAK